MDIKYILNISRTPQVKEYQYLAINKPILPKKMTEICQIFVKMAEYSVNNEYSARKRIFVRT